MADTTAWATIQLPHDADLQSFRLHKQDDRDLVVGQIVLNGWQAFERPLPDYVYKVARASPGLIVDAGANTGFYSLLAASAASVNKVFAFEPVPIVANMLDTNIRQNGLEKRVRPISCALSSSSGRAVLYMPTQEHGSIETSASLEADFKDVHSSASPVLVRTLDRAMLRLAPFARRVSLIKIDVEGHEASVMTGARWTIRRYRPIIFIEILPNADIDRLNQLIDQSSYRDVRLYADHAPILGERAVYDDASWNHAFVPEERLSWFCSL